jgi:UDP-GlcNAc:undecaprenyl-phosphate/decaprenyl-phosphate GlcNAc-1-phosphate transferase
MVALTVVVAFATSILICNLILRSVRWHLSFTADTPGTQPQKFHTAAVPRIGGVGLLLGMVAAGFLLPLSSLEVDMYWLLVLSLMPAFLGGFLEDITRKVGPFPRLLLTFITAGMAFSFAGVHFVRSDMDWFNAGLAYAPFGYLMLLFAVAGVAHAVNIIDGYHGLAGGVALIILAAMGLVAQQGGDMLVAEICYVTAGATGGFLLLNYPSGRLFLGDGGAYLLGIVIAFAGALLIQRNPEISPWFPMALVIYPVWETLFSMARRALVYRTKVGEPDARHLHSLVFRRVARHWVPGHDAAARDKRNYLTTLPFWAACVVNAGLAVHCATNTLNLGILIAGFIAGYCILYWRLARLSVPIRHKVVEALRIKPQTVESDLPSK